MQPGAKLAEPRERPTADSQEDAAFLLAGLWKAVQRDNDAMVELAVVRLLQCEPVSATMHDQGADKLRVNAGLQSHLRRAESSEVTEEVRPTPDGNRRHARRTVWRNDHDRVGSGRGQDVVELTHGFGGCPNACRFATAHLRQQGG